MKTYYKITANDTETDVFIYGDITSYPWYESDVSSYPIVQALEGVQAEKINVYINSYGGETAEGMAIHNALVRHSAEVTTYCDGFACSAASLVFMAGDKRVMYPASLLMIHNAWFYTRGNADELRKDADDLDIISAAAAAAYRAKITISDDELDLLLKNETWISPQEALEKGFATEIANVTTQNLPSQNVRMKLFDLIMAKGQKIESTEGTEKAEQLAPSIDDLVQAVLFKINENKEEPKQKTFFNFGGNNK